jgi:hypothetical protein
MTRLILLPAVLAASLFPQLASAGPKQAAAENACRQTFNEQVRGCQQTTSPPACTRMYEDKLGSCLADAATVVELSPGSGGGGGTVPPKTRLKGVAAPAGTAVAQ